MTTDTAARQRTSFGPVSRTLLHEVAKFGIVGVVNLALDVTLFNVLRVGGVGVLTSKFVSTTVAAVSSYFMNRHWSFAHRARSGTRRELSLFILLSAVALLLTEIPLVVSHYGLHQHSVLADNIAANVVGLGFGTVWRFWSFKRWVFLPPASVGEELASAAV